MSARHRSTTDHTHTHSASDGLLEALRRRREIDRAAAEPLAPGLRAVDANRAIVERAKGALMLRYGIDSHQAFAVMVRWARVTRTPVTVIAQTLMRGICEGNPQTELRQRSLVRWLEEQLRNGDPELAHRRAAPSWPPVRAWGSPAKTRVR